MSAQLLAFYRSSSCLKDSVGFFGSGRLPIFVSRDFIGASPYSFKDVGRSDAPSAEASFFFRLIFCYQAVITSRISLPLRRPSSNSSLCLKRAIPRPCFLLPEKIQHTLLKDVEGWPFRADRSPSSFPSLIAGPRAFDKVRPFTNFQPCR